MKVKLLLLGILLATLSCEKSTDDPVSDTEQEKMKSEVKGLVNSIFKGCEQADFELVTESCYDSPDFVYLFNGKTLTYQEFTDALKAIYEKMTNQVVTIKDEKYAVLDNSTILYTTNCTFLENFKDGHTFLADPMAMLFIFKKIDGRWRWIYGVESYGQ
jgi:hypothetical protein